MRRTRNGVPMSFVESVTGWIRAILSLPHEIALVPILAGLAIFLFWVFYLIRGILRLTGVLRPRLRLDDFDMRISTLGASASPLAQAVSRIGTGAAVRHTLGMTRLRTSLGLRLLATGLGGAILWLIWFRGFSLIPEGDAQGIGGR